MMFSLHGFFKNAYFLFQILEYSRVIMHPLRIRIKKQSASLNQTGKKLGPKSIENLYIITAILTSPKLCAAKHERTESQVKKKYRRPKSGILVTSSICNCLGSAFFFHSQFLLGKQTGRKAEAGEKSGKKMLFESFLFLRI